MQKTLLFAGVAILGAGVANAQSITDQGYQARMGEPLPGLSASDLVLFEAGKTAFNTQLPVGEGLGPIFNDDSCGACHGSPAIGGFGTKVVTRFGTESGGVFDPLGSLGGSLLQSQAIDPLCQEFVPPEATITDERITPHAFGAGLVESLPDSDLMAIANFPPAGVSGKAHVVQPLEGGATRVGRFGWKSQVATMLTFSADAGLNEMGLTNRFVGTENAPNGDLALLAACDPLPIEPGAYEDFPDAVHGLEKIDHFNNFQIMLAPPPQTPLAGMTGEVVFNTVGCADCHVASFTTPFNGSDPAFSEVTIKPYSDFLLHDVGSLGDGIADGAATQTEIRTASLWGVGQREALLHNGSATGGSFEQNIDMAILAHDGEGAASAAAYAGLTSTDKDHLYAFLRSLGRAEFDFENNNNVDGVDWFFIEGDFTGPGSFYTADDDEAISDVDQDGDFDMADWAVFQRAFNGTPL